MNEDVVLWAFAAKFKIGKTFSILILRDKITIHFSCSLMFVAQLRVKN